MDILKLLFLNEDEDDIIIENIGKLHIPTVKDIIKLDYENYTKLLIPYMISKQMFLNDEISESDEFKNFDLFFIRTPDEELLKHLTSENDIECESYQELLLQSLKFFFKQDVFLEDGFIIIGEGEDIGVLFRDNFDEIADIILKMNDKEKFKYEKPPVFENDRQRDIYNNVTEGRRRKEKEQSINFATIINTVMHGAGYFISYKEIAKMSIVQLMNTFNAIVSIDSSKQSTPIPTVEIDISKTEVKHWIQNIKIK